MCGPDFSLFFEHYSPRVEHLPGYSALAIVTLAWMCWRSHRPPASPLLRLIGCAACTGIIWNFFARGLHVDVGTQWSVIIGPVLLAAAMLAEVAQNLPETPPVPLAVVVRGYAKS